MRITGWRIDGYGALRDELVEDLPAGLTVVHGPNEAGKSSLLSFVRHILFGFPDGRSREADGRPVQGGRHGGALFLADDRDEYVLERHADSRQVVLHTRAGTPLDETALLRLRGGADRTLFAAVFAFGLDELASLRTLQEDEVRERVFSAGVLGAGRSAHAAVRALQARQDELVRKRAGGARANDLWKRLVDIDDRLRAARADARRFPEVARAQAGLEESLATLRATREDHAARIAELDLLSAAWTTQDAADTARRELAALGHRREDETLAAAAAAIERLGATADAHQADRRRHERLGAQRRELAEVLRRERALLEELGARPPDAPVRAEDVEVADALARHHGEAVAVLAHCRRALATAEEERAAREAALAEHRTGETLASADELVEIRRRLGDLRSRLAHRDRLLAAARDERVERLARRRSGIDNGLIGLLAALAVLLAAAAVLAARAHAGAAAALSAAGALGLLVVCALLARRARRFDASGEDAGREEELARVQAQVASQAAALGLPVPVGAEDLEERAEQLRRDEDARARYDHAAEAASAARVNARRAEEEAHHAAEQVRETDDRRRVLATRLGLPADLDPARLGDGARRLESAWRTAEELKRVDEGLAELSAALEAAEQQKAAVLERVAPALADVRGADDLDALLAEARKAVQRVARRARLEDELAGAERHLAATFGAGDRADRLRSELATGQVLAWQDERTRRSAALEDIDVHIEELVARRTRAEVEASALLSSAEIAELELERAGVVADLDAALRAFALHGTAKALLRRTLARYERERQPAVIRAAGGLFAEITDGRYSSLVAREAAEVRGGAPGIDVLAPDGRRIESDRLSRGAQEQLYLCLRLALAADFAERAARLPLLLDDVLVNFDPGRAKAVARALAATAKDNQVLAFTCHPHVVALLTDARPDARLVELARRP